MVWFQFYSKLNQTETNYTLYLWPLRVLAERTLPLKPWFAYANLTWTRVAWLAVWNRWISPAWEIWIGMIWSVLCYYYYYYFSVSFQTSLWKHLRLIAFFPLYLPLRSFYFQFYSLPIFSCLFPSSKFISSSVFSWGYCYVSCSSITMFIILFLDLRESFLFYCN